MTPTVVQSLGGNSTSSLTESLTFTGAVTAGNAILACALLSNPTAGQTWTSVTDNVNGAYTPIAGSYETTASMQWFYLSSSRAAGTNMLQVTCTSADGSAPPFTDLLIHEVRGVTNPVVVSAASSATGTSTTPAVSLPGCRQGDLLIGACEGSSLVVGSGFTLAATDGIVRSEWGVAAAGTNSVAFTSGNATFHASAVALGGAVNAIFSVSDPSGTRLPGIH